MSGDDKTTLLPDEVLDNAKEFGFEQYVKTITMMLSRRDVLTPITIAIHGDWGSGKSSLMKTIENVLNNKEMFKEYFKENEYFDFLKSKTIWFNAWEYECEDNIALLLLQYISNELEKDIEESKSDKLKKFMSVLGEIVVDTTLRKIGNITLQDVEGYITKNYKKRIEEISSLSDLYKQVVDEYIKQNKEGNAQIVVFIDDLDRCSIENSKSIIDAIRLFLTAENCIFIIGLDIKKLQRSLDLKYKDMGMGDFNAREYINKIVQLRFELPPLPVEKVKEYTKNLVSSDFKDEYIEIISEGIPANPRDIKLFINNLRFQLMLSQYQDFDINEPLLIEWLILKHSFPEFALEIENSPELLMEYHSEEVIAEYSRLDEKQRLAFLQKYGIKQKFVENTNLIKVLHSNAQRFSLEEVKNVIYQVKLTPTIIGQESEKEMEYLAGKIEHYFFNQIIVGMGYLGILMDDEGIPNNLVMPLFDYFDLIKSRIKSIIAEANNKSDLMHLLSNNSQFLIGISEGAIDHIRYLLNSKLIDLNGEQEKMFLEIYGSISKLLENLNNIKNLGDIIE